MKRDAAASRVCSTYVFTTGIVVLSLLGTVGCQTVCDEYTTDFQESYESPGAKQHPWPAVCRAAIARTSS